jgi:hypothetical protein
MNLDEWKKTVHPGRRVFLFWKGTKKYGTAFDTWSDAGIEPGVEFDEGVRVRITEKVVHLFRVEELS